MAKDPVCGMNVDPKTTKFSHYYKGRMYFFCSPSCKIAFENDPEKYLKGGPSGM